MTQMFARTHIYANTPVHAHAHAHAHALFKRPTTLTTFNPDKQPSSSSSRVTAHPCAAPNSNTTRCSARRRSTSTPAQTSRSAPRPESSSESGECEGVARVGPSGRVFLFVPPLPSPPSLSLPSTYLYPRYRSPTPLRPEAPVPPLPSHAAAKGACSTVLQYASEQASRRLSPPFGEPVHQRRATQQHARLGIRYTVQRRRAETSLLSAPQRTRYPSPRHAIPGHAAAFCQENIRPPAPRPAQPCTPTATREQLSDGNATYDDIRGACERERGTKKRQTGQRGTRAMKSTASTCDASTSKGSQKKEERPCPPSGAHGRS